MPVYLECQRRHHRNWDLYIVGHYIGCNDKFDEPEMFDKQPKNLLV